MPVADFAGVIPPPHDPDKVPTEVAGALAQFWAGGGGPSPSTVSTAFSLAGYFEPVESSDTSWEVGAPQGIGPSQVP